MSTKRHFHWIVCLSVGLGTSILFGSAVTATEDHATVGRSQHASHPDAAPPVSVTDVGGTLRLDNARLSVRLDAKAGTYSVSAGGKTFITSGRLRGRDGRTRVTNVNDLLGAGKAVEVTYGDGDADMVTLYRGVDFVCLRARLHNAGDKTRVVETITPVTVTVDLGKAAGDLRVLGCDGLTGADAARVSHAFLAMADPTTRAGVVAGWLTHHRGSGVVLSRPDASGTVFEGRTEYGKLRIAPGRSVEGETFVIGRFRDTLDGLEAFADEIARANRVKLPPPPSGYCTWYSRPHGGAADEKSMAILADFCKKNLVKFGFRVLQIDDRWQIAGRDFTSHNPNGPYPSGMKATADRIRAGGMTPGLWLIPFGWDPRRELFADHQDWFVQTADGRPYAVRWAGTCLDMTHPEAREFLRGVVSRITRQWGYKYIKIDGLWTGLAAKITYPNPTYRPDNLGDAVFHNPAKTNVQAYRDGLALVREAAGDDVFILGCNIAQNMRTLGASFGRVDGMRVGRDIGASWSRIIPCVQMGSRLYFLNGRVWYNDPDCLMLRNPLTLDQARAWGSWIAVTGQMNLVSEWLPELPDERLEVVRRSMPNPGLCGRPIDLFERSSPAVWQLTDTRGPVRRDVIGLFNWDAKNPLMVQVELSRLDLPDAGKGTYVGFDYWADRFVGPFSGALKAELPPGSCRIIAISPKRDRPQLVGTSRHITQGIIDVKRRTWDARAATLGGASLVVAGDPYQLRIVAPSGPRPWKAVSVEAVVEDGGEPLTVEFSQHGGEVRATIHPTASGSVRWKVKFDVPNAGS